MSAGYKSPPTEKQFSKGQSGCPSGRPKQAERLLPPDYLFRKVAFEEVKLGRDPVTVMTRWEALMRRIHIMANEDPSAARLLYQIRKQFPGETPTDIKPILVLSDQQMQY
jgi:hypothetical protein